MYKMIYTPYNQYNNNTNDDIFCAIDITATPDDRRKKAKIGRK